LAMVGLLCVSAAAVTEAWGSFGTWARWVCLTALLVKGSIYDRHFASDRAPFDNASLAAQWIERHVPPGSILAQPFVAPQPDSFPPVQFSRYQITSFQSAPLSGSDKTIFAKGEIFPGGQFQSIPSPETRVSGSLYAGKLPHSDL